MAGATSAARCNAYRRPHSTHHVCNDDGDGGDAQEGDGQSASHSNNDGGDHCNNNNNFDSSGNDGEQRWERECCLLDGFQASAKGEATQGNAPSSIRGVLPSRVGMTLFVLRHTRAPGQAEEVLPSKPNLNLHLRWVACRKVGDPRGFLAIALLPWFAVAH